MKSWIKVKRNPVIIEPEEFKQIWDTRPTTKHTVCIFGKMHQVPRTQVLYGENVKYSFSGNTLEGITPVPGYIQRCMKYVQKKSPDFTWNGALVNFYETGENYIGKHSDDETDLSPGSPIYSFSFGGVRTFRVRDKTTGKIARDILTENNSCIVMGGDFQKQFTHEITKTKKHVGPRINVTIRSFK